MGKTIFYTVLESLVLRSGQMQKLSEPLPAKALMVVLTTFISSLEAFLSKIIGNIFERQVILLLLLFYSASIAICFKVETRFLQYSKPCLASSLSCSSLLERSASDILFDKFVELGGLFLKI